MELELPKEVLKKQQYVRYRKPVRHPWRLLSVLGVVAVTAAILAYYPWLSIGMDNEANPNEPNESSIHIENNGFIPLRDISIECQLDFQETQRKVPTNNHILFPEYSADLSYKGKLAVPCSRTAIGNSDLTTVSLGVSVDYKIWKIQTKRTQHFSLAGLKDSSGRWHWTRR